VQLTIKVKAKRYPRWHIVVAAVIALLTSTFWAWVAYSVFGLALPVARRVFYIFSGVQLLFLPLMYLAYEKQFRDHSSRAVPRLASCFAGSIGLATLYFIAQCDIGNGNSTVKYLTIIFIGVSIVTGLITSLFLIKYEVK
jgi:putative Ca2+/H+ antiporter (TMEM165/GDT1 family)